MMVLMHQQTLDGRDVMPAGIIPRSFSISGLGLRTQDISAVRTH
jgi:hypothetical protein